LGHARRTLVARTAALFREHALDAVVTPTTPCVAPLRASALVELDDRQEPVDAALTRFTAWASATGLPAVAVPTGMAPLPTSVQFMAPPDREDTCLLLAQFIESVRTKQR
jgi:Asp-tRNA(Asn)/Glu-tRNA(Gln) amidotransferase A subunit family amidase